ncbi:MAG: cytochrome c oxidase assembly protein [Pseudomonadales bacterium]
MANKTDKAVSRTVAKLVLATVAMFGFGFALVPLYDVFCEITGLNGKTVNRAYEAVDVQVDESRVIKVQFIATNNDGMTWEFAPAKSIIRVHPGELAETTFFAKNPSDQPMTAQAIPSVQPLRAAQYFHKTECFCFNQQNLAAGETADMPLKFIIDQDLPKDVKTITLSYSLFDVTERMASR